MKTKILMLCAALALAGCTNNSEQGGAGTGSEMNTNKSGGGSENMRTNGAGGGSMSTNSHGNQSNPPQ